VRRLLGWFRCLLPRRHTPESVVAELIAGLKDGSIVLHRVEEEIVTPLPLQPLYRDRNGVVRFRANEIVEYLMTWAASRGMNMNVLAAMAFDAADREQFAQLVGYSLAGFGKLSYVTDETYARAEAAVPPEEKS
jgi:hypothetical protein